MKYYTLLFLALALVSCGNNQPAPQEEKKITQTPPPQEPKKGWIYESQTDEMSGVKAFMANIISQNIVKLNFPYGEVACKLSIGQKEKYNAIILSVPEGQFHKNAAGEKAVRLKFDNDAVFSMEYNEPSDGRSTAILLDYKKLIDKIKNADSLKIEVPFYDYGAAIFKFDLSGFSEEKMMAG